VSSSGQNVSATVSVSLEKSKSFERWHLMSAACVERIPVITQEPNKMEQKFARLLAELELESSYLSDHSIRLTEDL